MKFHVIEGNTQQLDGGAMFGNAPRALWERWVPPDHLHRIPLACRGLLLQPGDGRNILLETGVGAFFDEKMRGRYGVVESHHVLADSLQKVGVSPADIDVVVLSHLHFDHAGGLLSAHGDGASRLIFSKARFYVGRRQWERALAPHPRDRASYLPEIIEPLQASGRVVLVADDGHSDLEPLIRFTFSEGHTPGQLISHMTLDDGTPLVFTGDLIPASPWVNQAITMGYDRFPEKLIDEKTELLTSLEASRPLLFFTHDAQLAVGRLCRNDKGRFAIEPASLSAD